MATELVFYSPLLKVLNELDGLNSAVEGGAEYSIDIDCVRNTQYRGEGQQLKNTLLNYCVHF